MKNKLNLLMISLLAITGATFASVNTSNGLLEASTDINNNLEIELKNAVIGQEGDVDVSKTFTQFGMNGSRQFLRFATAVKGNVGKLTYNRSMNELGLNQKEVVTVYKGIQAGDLVYYYDGEKLTTNSELGSDYYWACYTIEFQSDTYLTSSITVSLDVESEDGSVTSSTPATTSLWEYKNAQDTLYIKTVSELKLFRDKVNAGNEFEGKTVRLIADIDLSNEIWVGIGKDTSMFRGTFDGNGYSIKNLNALTFDYYGNGFFRNVANATIKNVTFENAYVSNAYNLTYNNCCGIVAGYAFGRTTFENVNIINSRIVAFGKLGGFVGFQGDDELLTFKNCSIDGLSIKGTYNCGALGGLILNETHEGIDIKNYEFIADTGYGYTVDNSSHMIINEVAVAASGKTVKVDGLFWEWKYTQDYFIYYAASAELYCTFVLPYNEDFNLSNGFYVDSIPVNY